jgi:alpha-galactosidase
MKITYIGGGSKGWAHNYFSDLLLQDKLSGELALYDIDQKKAERNVRFFDKLKRVNKDSVKSEWTAKMYPTIEEALRGCDFVVISILPGTFNHMQQDVHYPEKYGVQQTVGDTVGAGGYSRALRTIPAMRFFGQKIKEICPDAYVINYTNPLAMSIYALYSAFPGIKAFGCCHEVFGTQKLLAAIFDLYNLLDDEGKCLFIAGNYKEVSARLGDPLLSLKKIEHKTARTEIRVDVVGINHFTWITRAEVRGQDLFPIYRGYAEMIMQRNMQSFYKKMPLFRRWMHNAHFVKLSLFLKYGKIAAAGDRHLVEFMPDVWLYNKKKYRENGFVKTYVLMRKLREFLRGVRQWYNLHLASKIKLKESGEEGVLQMTALMGLTELITNVNIPNTGYMSGIPSGYVVESNAKFSKAGIEPIPVQTIGGEIGERIMTHAQNQRDFVKAYFNRDAEGLFAAFSKDYSVAHLSEEKKRHLFEELIARNKPVLEDFLHNF